MPVENTFKRKGEYAPAVHDSVIVSFYNDFLCFIYLNFFDQFVKCNLTAIHYKKRNMKPTGTNISLSGNSHIYSHVSQHPSKFRVGLQRMSEFYMFE